MQPVRRPKPGDSDEQLLAEQRRFEREKTQSSVKLVRAGKKEPARQEVIEPRVLKDIKV